MSHLCFYILPRMLFWSRLTPILVLLCGGAFMLLRYLDPEPSEANIVSAFAGHKTRFFEAGPIPGISQIHKQRCEKVAAADGYLCTVSYTLQSFASQAPRQFEGVYRVFAVEGGQWGQQPWNKNVEQAVADTKERLAGHQFGLLLLYTAASILLAVVLNAVLPRLPWQHPAMHRAANPRVGRPIASSSAGADALAGGIADAANALTPAAAMGIFAIALGAGGFCLGGLVVPEALINLRYLGGAERLCLLLSGLSWGLAGARMPMLCIRATAVCLVLGIAYAVLVLPAMWVVAGGSPGQVVSKHLDAVAHYVSFDKANTGAAPRQGFEGYRHLTDW